MRTLLIWLCLTGLCFAEWVPVDLAKWRDSQNPMQYKARIGSNVANYDSNGTWKEIVTDWVANADSLWTTYRDILKTEVTKDGVSRILLAWGDDTIRIEQRLVGLYAVNRTTEVRTPLVVNPVFGTPTVNGNDMNWLFPGWEYGVVKYNGTLQHRIRFKEKFLDSLAIVYGKRADSTDLYLGNLMQYTISGVSETLLVNNPWVEFKNLKRLGRYVFQLQRQTLHFPGSDTLPQVPVLQRWVRQDDVLYCLEAVKAGHIDVVHRAFPNAVLWHNSTAKIEGDALIEDTKLYGYSDYNYGIATTWVIEGTHGTITYGIIRCRGVAAALGAGATGITAKLWAYTSNNDADDTVAIYRIFKPWKEGGTAYGNPTDSGATWYDWNADASEWTTEGCACAGDDGSDNNTDGGTCAAGTRDRKTTREDTTFVSAIDSWYSWDISTGLATGWYGGTMNEEGVLVKSILAAGQNTFVSVQGTTAAVRPYFEFTYTAGAGVTPRVIIVQ